LHDNGSDLFFLYGEGGYQLTEGFEMVKLRCSLWIFFCLLAGASSSVRADSEPAAFERTEERERCASYDPMRQPFFGTTHVHTRLSFDASFRFVPANPRDAFAFAKGERPILGADPLGLPTRTYPPPDPPLDWAAITDHSEHMAEVSICQSEKHDNPADDLPGRNSFDCKMLNGFYYQPGFRGIGEVDYPGDCLQAVFEKTGQCILRESGTLYPPAQQRSFATNNFTQLTIPGLGPASFNTRLPMCTSGEADCAAAEIKVWDEVQQAAHDAYDTTNACSFTSFVAYENTSTPNGINWHRNVIFRNANVPERPVTALDMAQVKNPNPSLNPPMPVPFGAGQSDADSIYEYGATYPSVYSFYDELDRLCGGPGNPNCEYLSIPHNSNLGGALGYDIDSLPEGAITPALFYTPENDILAEQRAEHEILVEIFQDKGGSECRYDPRFGAGTGMGGGVDELCDFELLDTPTVLAASGVSSQEGSSEKNPPTDFDPKAYVRNVLKDGLSYLQKYGVNPFKLGFVAGSDSHNGTAGWHPENETFQGHLGIEDATPTRTESTIQNNSGGHTVVWAEENSRDSIFAALKRRETYATSGTRPIVRFFGAWNLPRNICSGPRSLAAVGYKRGVPMGGDLKKPRRGQSKRGPSFVVEAFKDEYVGTDLSRIQIIKGWVDEEGETHEKVIHLAGDESTTMLANGNLVTSSGARVKSSLINRSCEPTGGAKQERLCGVYRDRDFDPDLPAFYYARVIENPVCRYSTQICIKDYGLDPLDRRCSDKLQRRIESGVPVPEGAQLCCNIMEKGDTTSAPIKPVIQERAWTSPIWYTPQS